MGEIIQRVSGELSGLIDPRERMREFIRFHLNLVEENPELAEVLQVELRQSNKFMREYASKHFIEYLNILSLIIRDGQKMGLFRRDIHPSVAKRAIFGALDEVSLNWVLSRGKRYRLRDSAEQIGELFIEGLLNNQKKEERRNER
jgi:TetR/AcrR family fatty acid metabolism transcriptional regulator